MSFSPAHMIVGSSAALTATFLNMASPALAVETPAFPPKDPSVITHVIEAKASCDAACAQAVARLVRSWNRYTDPAKCDNPAFREERSVEECRGDQMQKRLIGYGVLGAGGVAWAAIRGLTGDDRKYRL